MNFDKIKVFRKKNKWLFLVILISILITTYAQYPALKNHYIVNDDVEKDSECCIGLRCIISAPYDFIFQILWSFVNPVILSKITPFLVSIIFSIFLFLIGRKLRDNITGILIVILSLLHFWSIDIFFGGLRRGFGAMLFVMFFYYLIKRKPIGLIASIVLSIVTYPPIFPILCLSLGIWLIWNSDYPKRYQFIKKRRIPIITAILISLIIISSLYFVFSEEDNYIDYLKLPEFSSMGRYSLVSESNLYYQLTIGTTGLSLSPILNFIILMFLITSTICYKKLKIPQELVILLVASITVYIASFLVFPNLYYPAKGIRNIVPLFFVIVLSLNISTFLKKIPRRKECIKYVAIGTIIIGSLIIFYVSFRPNFFQFCPHTGSYDFIKNNLNPYEERIKIAGFPKTISCVYLFTPLKQTVNTTNLFINYEKGPQFPKDESQITRMELHKKATYELFNAYYSDNISEINSFCKRNRVTHIIIEPYLFSEKFLKEGYYTKEYWKELYNNLLIPSPKPKHFLLRIYPPREIPQLHYEPFDSLIRKLVLNNTGFALLNILDEKKIFEDKKKYMFIIKCPVD